MKRQSAEQCGYFLLHYLEDEVRAYMGEGRFSYPFDVEFRSQRLTGFAQSLLKSYS